MLKRDKKLEKEIATVRINKLLNLAEKMKFEDYELSRRYVELAKKIAMKYRTKIPKDKKFFCKKCMYPYRHDKLRVRVKKSRVIVTCLNCGYIKRIPIRKKNLKITKIGNNNYKISDTN